MRVSNGGRNHKKDYNAKSSLNSIEDKIQSGRNSLNKGGSSYVKKEEKVSQDVYTEDSKGTVNTVKEEVKVEESVKDNVVKDSNVKSKKKKNSKKRDKVKIQRTLGKLSGGRISLMVLTGLLSSTMITGLVYGVYYNQIRYPSMMEYDVESSGLGGINRWVEAINTVDNDTIKEIIGTDSYLAKEIEYANGNENKIKFIKKMISTVSYEPEQVLALNKYGNTMLERGTDEEVYRDSLVNKDNEKVTLHYIDYKKVPLDVEKISDLMSSAKLKVGDVDYSNKLVDVFVEYMLSLDDKDIPLVSIEHVPNMVKQGNKYYMLEDEDILLDKALFSSQDFFDFLTRFSLVAGGCKENEEWVKWNELSKDEKKDKEEPEEFLYDIQPRKEWTEWNSKSDEEKENTVEPVKYDDKQIISMDWCGSYYLLNDYEVTDEDGNVVKKSISAEIGDGTLENPAGLNTDIVTYIYSKEVDEETGKEKRIANPIRIRLVDYKVSQDALDYFETKDDRNRGYDIKSEVQYIAYTFEITNLSDDELVIYDDSTLADSLANKAPRTGTMFGLQDSVVLQPYETGKIESWGSSTELNTKYLIWGSDFKREKPVVWFRVLAGNIDDKSEDKGVALNNSRYEEDEE